MGTLIALVIFILILAGVAVFLKQQLMGSETGGDVEYTEAPLLSAAERVFFEALVRACGSDRHILAKVRLGDVITPKASKSEAKEWRRAFNMIQSKHLDFLVCEPGTLKVLCALELDDKSHRRADRATRDGFVEKALAGAGVPLARFPVQRAYKEQEITKKILETGRKSDGEGGNGAAFRFT